MLNFKKHLTDGTLTVTLEGKLDTATAPTLSDAILGDAETADALVLDMAELTYLSSAGLRLLLVLHKMMAPKGGLLLKNVNETNMEILDLTGFSEILNIE